MHTEITFLEVGFIERPPIDFFLYFSRRIKGEGGVKASIFPTERTYFPEEKKTIALKRVKNRYWKTDARY